MKPVTIAIVDYGIGNVQSIKNALLSIGVSSVLTNKEEEIMRADALILPGVGAFPKGMENLRQRGLESILEKFKNSGKPLLGICLGMQLLMEDSNEFGSTKGLGFIKGNVRKMEVVNEKLPHIAWSEILLTGNAKGFVQPAGRFYFVHSYAVIPALEKNIFSTTLYDGKVFCSAVIEGNILGFQFHPEKSGEAGLDLLRTFVERFVTHE